MSLPETIAVCAGVAVAALSLSVNLYHAPWARIIGW